MTEIRCTDACGRAEPTMEAASAAGWHCLQITGRWRCPDCVRALAAANSTPRQPTCLQEPTP